MKLPFRQGIVDAQKNGLGQPQYLLQSSTSGYVQLSAEITALTINVAHGSSDYLVTFNQNVDAAWGPVVSGVDNYLYFNIDGLSAAVSYGITTVPPIISTVEPSTPQVDQHWFDLNTTTMKVWNGAKWLDKIRLFAGKIPNGVLSGSSSTWCEPLYLPWAPVPQLQVESNPGYITTNVFGQPQFVSGTSLEFMTAKTPVRFITTVGSAGVLSQPTNAIFPVKASESIPAMSVVYFSGENQVGLATGNPAVNPPKTPVGIVQTQLMPGEIGILHQSGEVSYDLWDWSAHIGKPLYCGEYGAVVPHRPAGLLAYRVGFVKNRNTIVFHVDAETLPQIYQAGTTDVVINAVAPLESTFSINGLGEKVWTLEMPAATPSVDGFMTAPQAEALEDHGTRLTQAEADILNRSVIGHTHTIANVTGLQTTLDSKSPIGHTHTEYSTTTHNHNGYHALVVHSHTIPDVAGLQVELNGKAPVIHSHVTTDITGLQAELDTKIDKVPAATVGNFAAFTAGGGVVDSTVSLTSLSTTFAFANHTHSIAHVSGLQTALDGKAPVVHNHDGAYSPIGHTHTINELSDVDTASTAPALADALVWNGSQWVPGSINVTPGLQTIVVSLGATPTGTFTLRTTQATMQYWNTYLADQAGYLAEWGGVFDQATANPSLSFPTAVDATVPPFYFGTISAISDTAGVAPEIAAEVVINDAPTGANHFFVGTIFQIFPFNNSEGFSGNPGAAGYISNQAAAEVVGYGGVGDQNGLPPWQAGDVIGLIVRGDSTLRIFRNGVFVAQVALMNGSSNHIIVGAYQLILS